jgi:hypothetical protein
MFANTATATFLALSDSDHATKPDITITHPTVNVPTSPSEWKWHFVASTIEVKLNANRDPFDDTGVCNIGDKHDETIVQLARTVATCFCGTQVAFYSFLACTAIAQGSTVLIVRASSFQKLSVMPLLHIFWAIFSGGSYTHRNRVLVSQARPPLHGRQKRKQREC